MRDHTNRVYGVAATCVLEGMKPAALQPNVRMLDCEDSVERSERDHLGDPLVRGKGPGAMYGVTRPGALPLRGASTRTKGKHELFDTSVKILTSSNRSLHLYRLFSIHT